MKTTFRVVFNLFVTGTLVTLLSGCGGDTKKESAAEDVSFEESGKLSEEIKTLIGDLPSPTEVPYTLQATGADFAPELINGLTNVDNYLTNDDETALNLGIYATDVGYLVSYEKVESALEYTETCQKLAETLGVGSVFNIGTMERFQNNIAEPDSINAIFAESIGEVEGRLQASDRLSTAALILSGSFIEGLYLATQIIENYPTDVLDESTRNLILEPLERVILDQKKALDEVIVLLNDLPENETITKMTGDLEALKALYEKDAADVEEKIATNTGDFVLTKDMLNNITAEVAKIRKDIVDF